MRERDAVALEDHLTVVLMCGASETVGALQRNGHKPHALVPALLDAQNRVGLGAFVRRRSGA